MLLIPATLTGDMEKTCLYDIFISYSRFDRAEVEAIIEKITAKIPDLTYWFDFSGIESGDQFEDKIVAAIDNSDRMLFMVSDNAMASEWTKKEVNYAKNTGKRVVPLLLKGAKLKGWFLFKFGDIDCIDSTDPAQLKKFIANLSAWTGKEIAEIELTASDVEDEEEEEKKPEYGKTDYGEKMKQPPQPSVIKGLYTLERAKALFDKAQYGEAVSIYAYLAKQGVAEAQYRLGYCYYYAKGVNQDNKEAAKWYRKAAEQGHAEAQYKLCCCYYKGRGLKKNYAEATRWCRKAAEQGNVDAQSFLGYCYAKGQGVKQNDKESARWCAMAAEQGDFAAQTNLGVFYQKGIGVKKDEKEAVKWYRKAAENGNAVAQANLG